MHLPKVSVIMPAYNAQKYIAEAIDSILNQTFSNFELIIVNDASSDNTESIITSYRDPRIVYLKNETNLGVAKTLNYGLSVAQGEYIARMDADDISLPTRLEMQCNYLDANPLIAVLGTETETFLGNQIISSCGWSSHLPSHIKKDLFFSCGIAHPSVMIRESILKEMNGYDPEYNGLEDYELWYRISQKYNIAVLPNVLLRYRLHENQVTRNPSAEHIQRMRKLKERQVSELGIDPNCNEALAFYDAFTLSKPTDYASILQLNSFFQNALQANHTLHIYQHDLLRNDFSSVILNLTLTLPKKEQMKICRQSDLISPLEIFTSLTKRNIKHLIRR